MSAFFVVSLLFSDILLYLGLVPQAVLERGFLWQPVTYMFLHAGAMHILFNMLGIWMFGVELERMWGTQFFARYYAITGVGAGITAIVASLLPVDALQATYYAVTIGASGALYGLLMAFALYFPDRPILMFLLFPIPAKYFVMILGAHGVPDRARQPGLERRASGRAALRLPLPEEPPGRRRGQPQRGTQVPLSEVEDEPPPPQVRRLLRRPFRLGQARSLNSTNSELRI